MYKPKTPCYGCTERRTCCHSECPKYANYREKLDTYNKENKFEFADWHNKMNPKKNQKKLSGWNQ